MAMNLLLFQHLDLFEIIKTEVTSSFFQLRICVAKWTLTADILIPNLVPTVTSSNLFFSVKLAERNDFPIEIIE